MPRYTLRSSTRRGRGSTSNGAASSVSSGPATGANTTPLGERQNSVRNQAIMGQRPNPGTPGMGGAPRTDTRGQRSPGLHQRGEPQNATPQDAPPAVPIAGTQQRENLARAMERTRNQGIQEVSEQMRAFSQRIADLEGRLAASIRGRAQGAAIQSAQNPELLRTLIENQRQSTEVMARLVSRTWKPPTHVVEFSEDQDWASYSQYLSPLSGHLDPSQEVRLIIEKAIKVPKGKKVLQHEHLPQLIWDQALKEVAATLHGQRVDLRNEQHARKVLDRFYHEMRKRYPEKRSSLKVEAMRQELKRVRRKDESMEAFINALQRANLLLEKHRPELKISEMELAQRVIDQINDANAEAAMNLETKKPGGRMDCNSLQEYVGWHWQKDWKLPRFVTDEKAMKTKKLAEVNAITLKHCSTCKRMGRPDSVVKSHNTSECKAVSNGSWSNASNKRMASMAAETPSKKKPKFVRQCWYCKQTGHFMLSREQNSIECPILLSEYSRPKCHHPGCNGRDHIAQYHENPEQRHRIEGNVVNSCRNVVIGTNQSGNGNKSSMIFEVEGLSEEEARERFENGELRLEQ